MKERTVKRVCAAAAAGLLLGVQSLQAHQEMFVAYLDGATEAPPNASTGVGTMLITLDVDVATLHVQMKFDGLAGDSDSIGLHGRTTTPESGLAGLAVPFPSPPVGTSAGQYDYTIDLTQASSYTPQFITASGGAIVDALNGTVFGLLRKQMYVSLASSAYPEGEIRGFAGTWPDAVRDGTINTLDFDALAAHFNASPTDISSGDFNLDSVTNALDFNGLAQHFGETVDFVLDPPEDLSPLSPVPEPWRTAFLAPAICWLRRTRLQSLHVH